MPESLGDILLILVALMAASVVVAVIGLLAIMRHVRNLRIPREADFFTAIRMIPLALVILLDLLDFGLDIFAAPISWIVLDRMGLPQLRNKAAIEALIPFTSPIPTFTLCWIAARLFNLGEPAVRYIEYYNRRRQTGQLPDRRPPTIIDMDDRYR